MDEFILLKETQIMLAKKETMILIVMKFKDMEHLCIKYTLNLREDYLRWYLLEIIIAIFIFLEF